MAHHRQLCCIIPNYILQSMVDSERMSDHSKGCAQRSIHHNNILRGARSAAYAAHGDHSDAFHGIVPSYVYQDMIDQGGASGEQIQHARKSMAKSDAIRAAREGAAAPEAGAKAKRLYRTIYDSESSNELPGQRLRKEGQVTTLDTQGTNVWNTFGNTFNFYYNFFHRNSIDDLGLSLVASIHYDDELPPPGYNNAFWNGQQMVFGDGDSKIFQDFTRSPDVIGHELTHGVTQYTANLPYHFQSGALNESISDVFGPMVKQWNGGQNSVTADKADWLIGEGIFFPTAGIPALRSMKAPGTAYQNTMIGSDRQPDHMSKYKTLPDTEDGDEGGVHINSGIPNKAFYLAATGLGGYSWEIAGQIWYDTLLDPELRTFAAPKANWTKAFSKFADLTVKHAQNPKYKKDGKDIPAIISAAWQGVGVDVSATVAAPQTGSGAQMPVSSS